MNTIKTLSGALLLALAGGCGEAATEPQAEPQAERSTAPVEDLQVVPVDDSMEEKFTEKMEMMEDQQSPRNAMVQKAVDDLAARLGVEASSIQAGSLEPVMWRDGSMGCPKPGMQYTQALIPGYRIMLSDGSRTYWYHGRKDGEPFLCENPKPPAQGEGGHATE